MTDLNSVQPVVDRSGIYFITNAPNPQPGKLMYYRFPNGPLTTVDGVERPAMRAVSISPDRRWLLYTKVVNTGADLMLVENFK
jgi:hypothetical protein